jgi:hypothetical protein
VKLKLTAWHHAALWLALLLLVSLAFWATSLHGK